MFKRFLLVVAVACVGLIRGADFNPVPEGEVLARVGDLPPELGHKIREFKQGVNHDVGKLFPNIVNKVCGEATLGAHNGGHNNAVRSVCWNSAGTKIFSGSQDGTIKIWDVATWACEATLLVPEAPHIQSVSLNEEGTKLASGSFNDTTKIWDVATRACEAEVTGNGVLWSVSLNSPGTKVACGGTHTEVKIWDIAQGTNEAMLTDHGSIVWSVCWNRAGTKIASGSSDRTVKVWDAASRVCDATLEGHGSPVLSVIWNKEGTKIISGSLNGAIKIWDVAASVCEKTFKLPREVHVRSVNLNEAETKIVCGLNGETDGKVKILNFATGVCEATVGGDEGRVWSVCWNRAGTKIAAAFSSGAIKIWNTEKIKNLLPVGVDMFQLLTLIDGELATKDFVVLPPKQVRMFNEYPALRDAMRPFIRQEKRHKGKLVAAGAQ